MLLRFKPLSHWDATSSRWVCESIRQTVANCHKTFAWYRKVLACIANSSQTCRQSFKHAILFCATKIITKPSPSHRICRERVANPSPTLCRRSQTHRKEVSVICTMRQICDINEPFRDLIAINKTDQNSHERRETLARMSHDCLETLARISRDCRETVARMSHDCRTVMRRSHECLTTVVRHSRECRTTVVRLSSIKLNIYVAITKSSVTAK